LGTKEGSRQAEGVEEREELELEGRVDGRLEERLEVWEEEKILRSREGRWNAELDVEGRR